VVHFSSRSTSGSASTSAAGPLRPLRALRRAGALVLLACAGPPPSVVEIAPHTFVAHAEGGSGAAGEERARDTALDAARAWCGQRGMIAQVDSIVSTPTRARGAGPPSASVTFRCERPGSAGEGR